VLERSSNYREFRNLAEGVWEAAGKGKLRGAEVFIFTDNLVAEPVFYRGSSKEQTLYELVFDLKKLSLDKGFLLHIVHVAGTRMIQQGTIGLLRGELHLGGLLGKMENVVPLHLDPMTRSAALGSWLESWLGEIPDVCTPKDWFYQGHKPGKKVWSLQPAAAIEALEELALARLKRMEEISSLVLVPALLWPEWSRHFVKTVNLYIPAGSPVWPAMMHEALIVGLSLPFVRYSPWEWRRVPFLVGMARTLSGVHKNDHELGRDISRKFWRARARTTSLPEGVVREMLDAPTCNNFLGLSGKGCRWERNDGKPRG
jgi:hypothetical protein